MSTAPWVVHDIRRTVRTRLASLRVSDLVAEMVIGHGRKGIQRVYDQHTYEPEMREALELWAARLRDIVTPPPENVVQTEEGESVMSEPDFGTMAKALLALGDEKEYAAFLREQSLAGDHSFLLAAISHSNLRASVRKVLDGADHRKAASAKTQAEVGLY